MKRSHLLACCFLVIALTSTACKRDAEPDVPAPPAATPEATASEASDPSDATDATDATVVADLSSPVASDADFDARAFAGAFAAPGARLEIDADGGYRMSVRAQSANADLVSTGTWTLEPGSQHILLDPDSKSDPDRRYALVSNDELRADDGGETLRRESE